jgi:hypothetical protein
MNKYLAREIQNTKRKIFSSAMKLLGKKLAWTPLELNPDLWPTEYSL